MHTPCRPPAWLLRLVAAKVVFVAVAVLLVAEITRPVWPEGEILSAPENGALLRFVPNERLAR